MGSMCSKAQIFIKKHTGSVKEQLSCLPMLFRPYWFGFERHFGDGLCLLLATDAEVYEHHFRHENLLVSTPQNDKLKSNMEFDYKAADGGAVGRMKDEMQYFAHGDTFILIRYTKAYFDVFYFAYKNTDIPFFSNLLNDRFVLRKFARHFLNKFEKILKQGEGYVILPEKMQNPRLQLRYTPGSVWVERFEQYVTITKKELEASILSAQGKLQQEIADIMNISIRTVETNLAKARGKLQVTKEEFIEIFFNYF